MKTDKKKITQTPYIDRIWAKIKYTQKLTDKVVFSV